MEVCERPNSPILVSHLLSRAGLCYATHQPAVRPFRDCPSPWLFSSSTSSRDLVAVSRGVGHLCLVLFVCHHALYTHCPTAWLRLVSAFHSILPLQFCFTSFHAISNLEARRTTIGPPRLARVQPCKPLVVALDSIRAPLVSQDPYRF